MLMITNRAPEVEHTMSFADYRFDQMFLSFYLFFYICCLLLVDTITLVAYCVEQFWSDN